MTAKSDDPGEVASDKNIPGGVPGFMAKLQGFLNSSKEFSLDALAQVKDGGRKFQGPLNGLVGDRLAQSNSPLAIALGFYRYHTREDEPGAHFSPLKLNRESMQADLGRPAAKVCIFIHGLGSSERTWLLRRKGEALTSYAPLLERDTGHSSFFVRYNTGRHISQNGRQLAEQLEVFVETYPTKLSELNLIGHSMGGLVSRSAAYYAEQAGHKWLKLLKRSFLLGSPLLGAHQEQIGKLTTDILDAFPLPATKITSFFIDLRSAGIQDLGYGYLTDADWDESAGDSQLAVVNKRRAVPLVEDCRYYLVVGSLSKNPEGIVANFFGDGIVNRSSARGAGGSNQRYEQYSGVQSLEIPGLNHVNIPGDSRVYRQLRTWLRD